MKKRYKRFLALYFEASLNGEQLPDQDGAQYMETDIIGFGDYVREKERK